MTTKNKSIIFIPTVSSNPYYAYNIDQARKTWIKKIDTETFDYFFIDDTTNDTYIDDDFIYLQNPVNKPYSLKNKIKNIFRFFQNYNYQYKYYIRCDDDSYIDPQWVANIVGSNDVDIFGMLGYTQRFSLNNNSSYMWPHGCFYGLHYKLLNKLIDLIPTLPEIPCDRCDDVMIGYLLQNSHVASLNLSKHIWNGFNYQYVKNLNNVMQHKVVHSKNTSLYHYYDNNLCPDIFDMYHALIHLSGQSIKTLDTIDRNESCFNLSFDSNIYSISSSQSFENYVEAYRHWMQYRTVKNYIYNFHHNSAYHKNIIYYKHMPNLENFNDLGSKFNDRYNTIYVLPDKPLWKIPFNCTILINDTNGYHSILEDIVANSCNALNIRYI